MRIVFISNKSYLSSDFTRNIMNTECSMVGHISTNVLEELKLRNNTDELNRCKNNILIYYTGNWQSIISHLSL